MAPVPSPHRRRPLMAGVAIVAGLVLGTTAVAVGQGASISVEPIALEAGSTTLTVTGTGFETAGNGVYVVFGPITAAPGFYSDPSIYGAFRWVHSGAGESPVEAALAADGSFSTTLQVSSTFTTPAGDIDCAVTACAVITFAAHGSPDRSQDTCVAIPAGGSGSPAPYATPNPATTVTDPCEPITGGTPVASGVPEGSPAASPAASGAP